MENLDILDRNQLKEINDIIQRHIGIMLHLTVGEIGGMETNVDQTTLARLGLPSYTKSVIDNAFVLGKLVQILKRKDLKNMTFEELKNRADTIHLTDIERNSLEYAKQNAAQYVKGLGQRITSSVLNTISDQNQAQNLEEIERGEIRSRISRAVIDRESQGKVISALGHMTGDWTRDWMRLVHTELWNAKLTGEAVAILSGQSVYSQEKRGDTLVFRRPSPDACPECKKLYLRPDGVTPRIFKLKYLIRNGTNVGRKRQDWRPVVQSTHPNCACTLSVIPDGFGFDKDGRMVFVGSE